MLKQNNLERIMGKIGILLIIVLINLSFILAQENIIINKTIDKLEIYPNEILGVTINVENNGNEAISGTLADLAPEFAQIEGNVSMEIFQGGGAGVANFKTFSLNIASKSSVSSFYRINFSGVPDDLLNKSFNLGKSVFTDNFGDRYLSNSPLIFVKPNKKIICNHNYKCEPSLGENHGNCLQDCLSGLKDNYCDGLTDGRCDPDCTIFQDRDCLNEKIKVYSIYLIIVAIVIFLIVLGIIFWRKFKSKL